MAKPLSDLRAAIDAVDAELLRLLNERAALSVQVGQSKEPGSPVQRPGREAELIRGLRGKNPGPLPGGHIENIYREILSSSRALQRVESVGYCGLGDASPGAVPAALVAGFMFLGRANAFHRLPGLDDLFRSIAEMRCDLGLVPLEHEGLGCVEETVALFEQYPLHIRAEIFLAGGSGGISWTRFALVGRFPADRPDLEKSSALFRVGDPTRDLPGVLRVFADAGVVLSGAQAFHRPLPATAPGGHFPYLCFVDFACDIQEEGHAQALAQAAMLCSGFRVLGGYPAGAM